MRCARIRDARRARGAEVAGLARAKGEARVEVRKVQSDPGRLAVRGRQHYIEPLMTATLMPGVRELDIVAAWAGPFSEPLGEQLLQRGKTIANAAAHSEGPSHANRYMCGPIRAATSWGTQLFSFIAENDAATGGAFVLRARPAPKSEPPAWALAAEKKVGGFAAFEDLVRAAAAGVASPVITYNMAFKLDANDWECAVLPRLVEPGAPDAAAMEVGDEPLLEQVGYRYKVKSSGVEEVSIVYAHSDNTYRVTVQGRAALQFAKELEMPALDELLEPLANHIFSPRRPRSDAAEK